MYDRSIVRLIRIAAAIGVIAAMLPAASQAAQIAPPGKAGATQYFETIPTSRGNVAPPGSSSSPPPAGPTLATTGTGATGTQRLASRGSEGKAAAAFAKATAPVLPSKGLTGAATAGSSNPKLPAEPASGSATGGLTSLLTGADAGGIGILLPILLALALLGAGAVAVSRTVRR